MNRHAASKGSIDTKAGMKAGMSAGARAGMSNLWQQRSARERRVLAWGGMLLVIVLLWLLAIEPALDGRERWRKDLPQLRSEAAQVQALAQQLSSAPPRATASAAASPTVDKAMLESSLAAQGLKAQALSVQDAGGVLLVRVNLDDASFSALTEWLQQQQRASQLSVSEASVTARERLDRVDARLTLRRPP